METLAPTAPALPAGRSPPLDGDAALAELRSNYLRNLAALYRVNPTLAARLESTPFGDCPTLEAARAGGWTARARTDDGREVYLHSRYNPRDEADKLVAEAAAENPTFVLRGVGLGYVAAAIAARYRQPLMLVCEDDLALLKAALCVQDLSSSLNSQRLLLLTSADRRELHALLHRFTADFVTGVTFLALPYAGRCRVEFQRQASAALADFASTARMHMLTLLRTSQTTFRNVAFNLRRHLESPGAGPLAGRGRGYPAIVVAAGPSLARNIQQLPAVRDRAVIIAVQTVLKPLLAAGCVPHFVTSLDFHEISTEFFAGAAAAGDCTLVAEPKAAWQVLDAFRGPVCVLQHKLHEVLLGAAAPPRGTLKPGATVAHLAFYLAQHLGCDPILFVGQDLAFSDGLFYMPGSPIEETWRPELNSYCTLEMKQWERIVRNRPILRRTQDLHGAPVYTDDLLFTYAEQFRQDFAGAAQRVLQCSEGGLLLQGMQPLPLADAIAQFCNRPLDAAQLRLDAPAPAEAQRLRASGAAQLRQRIAELEQVREIAAETESALEQLTKLVERPAEFNRLIARVDELRSRMQRFDRMYGLVVDVSAHAELRRYAADRRLGDPTEETADTARRRLQRDLEFVRAFRAGCDFLHETLPQACARLEDA